MRIDVSREPCGRWVRVKLQVDILAWHDFLVGLKDRGLASPLLVISDGAPGLISAIEQAYPKALRQRCLVHRSRKESTCGVVPCSGCEELGGCAVAGWRRLGKAVFRAGAGAGFGG